MASVCWRGRNYASKVRALRPVAFGTLVYGFVNIVNEVSLRELSCSAVFSQLRPVLKTTCCKSRSEDRAILLTMFAGAEYSRERNNEHIIFRKPGVASTTKPAWPCVSLAHVR